MKVATRARLDAIDEGHDWEEGQVYGHGGTAYSSTDRCQMCGLTRHWSKDEQNGQGDSYTFSRGDEDYEGLIDVPTSCDS